MTPLARTRAALEGRWFDPLLAVLVCGLSEWDFLDGYPHRHGSKLLLALLVAAMASSLVWRRRAPLAFALWTAGFEALIAGTVASIGDSQSSPWLLIIPAYTVAAMLPGRRALVGVAASLGSSVWVGFAWSQQPFQDASFVTAVILVAAGFGRMVRSRRQLDQTLIEKTRRLATERERRVRVAVADERSRIARELHAVVANSVSAMVVHAEGAQRLIAAGDPSADAAMHSIERMGRTTLEEIRRMLGVLRDSGDGVLLSPLARTAGQADAPAPEVPAQALSSAGASPGLMTPSS
jgi:signal transduction histidine kinase